MDFLQVLLCRFLLGRTGHVSNQCLWYFFRNASWSVESCWYYTPIVTAAIPVVMQGTGAGAPALRAKATGACNQAFWYGLVQSHPMETKHRWRPVIHVHQWVTQPQTGCSWPSALEFVKSTKIIISEFAHLTCTPRKRKTSSLQSLIHHHKTYYLIPCGITANGFNCLPYLEVCGNWIFINLLTEQSKKFWGKNYHSKPLKHRKHNQNSVLVAGLAFLP